MRRGSGRGSGDGADVNLGSVAASPGGGQIMAVSSQESESTNPWSSPTRTFSSFKSPAPQTHRLPFHVMWGITLLTASGMALINFCTIWVISFVVEWKFNTMQACINGHSIWLGIAAFVGICAALASTCMFLIFTLAPMAGSSGAPENKGWLNGNDLPGFFTRRNMIVRQMATMLANMAGYPVGREGPTVTLGSNLATLITKRLALPYVQLWVDLQPRKASDAESPGTDGHISALMIDEERFVHATRIVCTVGGACGMAMLFDSPIGGIVYMFEEITSSSWPMEVTLRAFVGTTVCAVMSRALLNLCGTTTKAFVVYEFNPQPDSWSWIDMPFFILLAGLLGPFSAWHTRACLKVGTWRQKVMSKVSKRMQLAAKVGEAILYIIICALTYTTIALLARCFDLPGDQRVEFVRYNCPEGQYNPVASLLLTTSEGAVKRLFSRKNANELHLGNECLAFLAYSTLNICLTGVPVPSGNFTGSMLIGGLAGRIVGAAVRHVGVPGVAASGIYAMIGSAAMLCGFKQMCVAVVVFISGCANDLNLVPPLMVSITVALLLNRMINERGFDEEQILRKKVPFLPAEPPGALDGLCAWHLADEVPLSAELPPEAELGQVRKVLQTPELEDVCVFPVISHPAGGVKTCVGFTTRERLQAAVKAAENPESPTSAFLNQAEGENGEAGEDESLLKLPWKRVYVARSFSLDSLTLHLARLADRNPYTLLELMPAARAYALFSRAGAWAACLISASGEYRGMISKSGLIKTTRRIEEDAELLQSFGSAHSSLTTTSKLPTDRGHGRRSVEVASPSPHDASDSESSSPATARPGPGPGAGAGAGAGALPGAGAPAPVDPL